MRLDIAFDNSRSDEREQTLRFLQEQGAVDIAVRPSAGGLAYSAVLYVEGAEDIQRVLHVLLYAQDRSAAQLRGWTAALPPAQG